jgi:ferredoxin-fold anticodon binding domain-containing protein
LIGEEDAKVAALVAVKMAEEEQRAPMREYLEVMAMDINMMIPDRTKAKLIVKRLTSLKEEIEVKEWDIQNTQLEKQRLKKLNPEYFKALTNVDPDVFVRKYPQLFQST